MIKLRILLAGTLIIALIPSIIFSLFTYQSDLNDRRDLILKSHLETAGAVATAVDAFILDAVKTQDTAGLALVTGPGKTAQQIKTYLATVLADNSQFSSLSFFSPEGKQVATTAETAPPIDLDNIRAVQAGRSWEVSDLEHFGDDLHIHVTTAIRQNGQLKGILDSIIPDEAVARLVKIRIGQKGNIGVIDSRGWAITLTFDPNLPFAKRYRGWIPSVKSALKGRPATINSFHDNLGNVDRLGASVPIAKIGWVANVFEPVNDILAPVRQKVLRQTAGVFLATFIALAIVFMLSLILTGSLDELVRGVIKFGQGDFRQRVSAHRAVKEIAELASSFNRMADQVTERFEVERHIAGTLQKGLLPGKIPKLAGFEISVYYASATKGATVGGDFYDFIPLTTDLVGLVIGDVSGKGVEAATSTAVTKFLLRDLAYRIYRPDEEGSEFPAAVVRRLNETLYREVTPDQFVTLFYGLLNLRDATLSYANAGHPPPFVCSRTTHICRQLEGTNLILGAIPDFEYIDGRTIINQDETLVLFTDGVLETRNHLGQAFGEEGLAEALANIVEGGEHQARLVFEACRKFGGGEITDDFACVMIKRVG